ncbi:calponin homology domain-containing protein DDB_G0272472-like [Stegodyphus dumicola]|uniref:calponin homology domain-containing protein DDB_G0272472-like n=1 Tax=Stegodyphus dumicola TaxID=202533 RepID=UPI0015AA0597|nr:calponin homology domain-containing protein DDB_G0272472-like [Stegodyphus dumicola]
MAKKGKGKKGKKGGKKGKKKESLSNLDKQKFLLEINSLENKIEWRRQLCEIIEEGIEECKEVYETELQDKNEAVQLLEEAIEEQTSVFKKLKRAIPQVESAKIQTQDALSRELALSFIKENEEKSTYDAQLEIYRRKHRVLKNYNAEETEERIEMAERKFHSVQQEETYSNVLKNAQETEKNLLREFMQESLEETANIFQMELKGRIDESFERIVEERRWWNDKVNSFSVMAHHLNEANRKLQEQLKLERKKLSSRRAASLQVTVRLQQQKALISAFEKKLEKQREQKKINLQTKRETEDLGKILDQTIENLKAEKEKLKNLETLLENNEMEIKGLEQQLTDENQFGHYLTEVTQAAHSVILDEVRHPLIITYDGPPEKKNALLELQKLFCEAMQRIYENRTSKAIYNVEGVQSLISKK